LGSLPIFALVGLFYFRGTRVQNSKKYGLKVGEMDLDEALHYRGQKVELTGTEMRILKIFAASPNTVIERSRLQQEIWEGVIVSRSLDMFISKLRKKLEIDSSVKIEVVRGKGYIMKV
jgi:DNA-binding response OmpR family regulator